MKVLGNIVWFLFGGLIASVAWFLSGIILCITIIGIPFGVQCFKISRFVLWPFGTEIELGHFGVGGLLLNVVWLIIFGWELAVTHLIFGALLCVTIIGIPFGLQHFKFALLSLSPFGARLA